MAGKKNVVDINQMGVGRAKGGKHWTAAEVAAREKAAAKVTRAKRIGMRMPDWLNEEAQKVWKKTIRDMQGFDILDKIDEDILAIYCDTVARYKECTEKIEEQGYMTVNQLGTETINAYVRAQQGYRTSLMQYATKLGITAEARARLAKKIADKELDPNAELFN